LPWNAKAKSGPSEIPAGFLIKGKTLMTSTAKQELTSAEKYRQMKRERMANAEICDFTSPSGIEWKLRRPDLQQFILSGVLPLSLASKIKKAADAGKSDADAFADLALEDQIRTLEFTQAIVRYCAVSPRIVMNPIDGQDEIGVDEVEPDDFQAISAWAMSGGAAAAGLDTFRNE
jgi:hypothetical protein